MVILFILVCACLEQINANGFENSSGQNKFEPKQNELFGYSSKENTLIRKLVDRLEAVESLTKQEHERNQLLKERIVELEKRDKQREERLSELEKRCTILQSNLKQKKNSTDVNSDDAVTKRNVVRPGHDELDLVTEIISKPNEMNLQAHLMGKGRKRTFDRRSYRMLQNEIDAVVAFSASLKNHYVNTGVNQVIIFENVVTNVGNGYNQHAGDFRAPVRGIYIFSVTLMTYHDTTSGSYSIRRNGTISHSMYLRGETGSLTVIYELNKGDDVSVVGREAKTESLWGHGYSIFSGFLLRQIHPETDIIG